MRNLIFGLFFILLETLTLPFGQAQSVIENPSQQNLKQLAITALVVRSEKDLGNTIYIAIQGRQIPIYKDPEGIAYSYFISFDSAIAANEISISLPEVLIFYINSGRVPAITQPYLRVAEACAMPMSIDQAIWREGLPEPNYTRIFTEVSHVIVHHAAGSNTNTNYTQVVRDIYLYHTQVNGWSDIGYNYLVAQNGTIYSGRDPGNGDQDNVMGAHFCGANTGTMGICMLGNYETATVTTQAFESLQQLITFKMYQDGLDPTTTRTHALGELKQLSGHRDGCSTLCPGENLYQKLDELRSMIQLSLAICDDEVSVLNFTNVPSEIAINQSVRFTNQSFGYENYQWLFDGGIPAQATWSTGQVQYPRPGYFDVTLIGHNMAKSDTIIYKDRVHVLGPPLIFPNPVTSGGRLRIQSEWLVQDIHLYGMDGQELVLKALSEQTYQLPQTENGLYALRVSTLQTQFTTKLLVTQ